MSYITETAGKGISEAVRGNIKAMANCESIVKSLSDVYHALVREGRLKVIADLPEDDKQDLRDIILECLPKSTLEYKMRFAEAVMAVSYYN